MKEGLKYISKKEYDALVKKHKYITQNELIKFVNDVIDRGGRAYVKFICQYCGIEQTSTEPNVLHRMGYICSECGELSTPELYGLMVVYSKDKDSLELVDRIIKEKLDEKA